MISLLSFYTIDDSLVSVFELPLLLRLLQLLKHVLLVLILTALLLFEIEFEVLEQLWLEELLCCFFHLLLVLQRSFDLDGAGDLVVRHRAIAVICFDLPRDVELVTAQLAQPIFFLTRSLLIAVRAAWRLDFDRRATAVHLDGLGRLSIHAAGDLPF